MFVIMRLIGEYSDRDETPVLITSTEDVAKRLVDKLGKAARVLVNERTAFYRDVADPLRETLTDKYPPYHPVTRVQDKDFWAKWMADPLGKKYKAVLDEAEARFRGLYDTPTFSYTECDEVYSSVLEDVSKYVLS